MRNTGTGQRYLLPNRGLGSNCKEGRLYFGLKRNYVPFAHDAKFFFFTAVKNFAI